MIETKQYGGARGRRWRVEWTETPQPIQVKINCIRGLKDKVCNLSLDKRHRL